jgi:hypothetical protein
VRDRGDAISKGLASMISYSEVQLGGSWREVNTVFHRAMQR